MYESSPTGASFTGVQTVAIHRMLFDGVEPRGANPVQPLQPKGRFRDSQGAGELRLSLWYVSEILRLLDVPGSNPLSSNESAAFSFPRKPHRQEVLDQMDHFGITPIYKFAPRYGRKKSPAVEPPSGLFCPNVRVVEIRLLLDVTQKLLTDL